MKQARTKLAQTIADKTLQSGISKPFAKQVAAYLLAENRVGELDSLLRDVQADWAQAGKVEVIAATAHPLSADVQRDITRQVKQVYPQVKAVIITEKLDPTVIGGVRLSLPNQQLDISIEAKLNKFRQLTAVGKDV